MFDAIVIGAGASGLICAGRASERGLNVLCIEHNEKAGKKIYITGKGRCNITNACEAQEFFSNVISNPKFCYSACNNFNYRDIINLLEQYGLKTKIERGNRVFPISDKASDVTNALLKYCKNVQFLFNSQIESIKKENDLFKITINSKSYYSKTLVLATGGKSYHLTGSDGSGFDIAKLFGHSVIPLVPSLVPIKLKDNYISNIEGLSLKNVSLNCIANNFKKSIFGEMLFTKDGISGPIALTMSSYINRKHNISLSIDFKPTLDRTTLIIRLEKDCNEYKDNELNTMLKTYLPQKLVPIFVQKLGINGKDKVKTLSETIKKNFINLLKEFCLEYDKLYDIEYGIITSGGVDTKEINPKTMESKITKNLFFCGEIIDIDALTGGFNLQLAWSTGYQAGNNILLGE